MSRYGLTQIGKNSRPYPPKGKNYMASFQMEIVSGTVQLDGQQLSLQEAEDSCPLISL
jgi:hypothetical protein